MRRRQQRHHPVEALDPQPDDLLLAADPAVVRREAPGPLAHRQLVLHDPREVARGDPRRPLPLHRSPLVARHRPHRPSIRSAPVAALGTGPAERRPPGGWPHQGGRLHRARHVVDPDHRRARQHGPGGGGDGARQAVAPRPAGSPVGPGRQAPEEALAARPHEHREALGHELGEVVQQGQVVRRGLAEADAGVHPHLAHPGLERASAPGRAGRRAPRRPRRRSGGRPAWCAASPCMCMATHPTPDSAATGHSDAEMSLTRVAPAATAASATARLTVSTDTRTWGASASITGTTRRSSSRSDTGSAPGRLDSPPTSTTSAPWRAISRPCATARSASR